MKRGLGLLAAAVVLRMVFHAVYLPAFEGPDEPHHLARVHAFAFGDPASGFVAASVPAEIVAAVSASPCGPLLARAYGCPPFSAGAVFNLLHPAPKTGPAVEVANPEANQPPLFYLVSGSLLRLAGPREPHGMLLFVRLLNVAMVAAAIFGPLRKLAAPRPASFAVLGLLGLLLPGASESLARSANDASVFLWSSLVIAALDRGARGAGLVALVAAGPLLKLTAIPIVVFAVVSLWMERRVRLAAACVASGGLVFAVQALRGWSWGGTVELNTIGGSSAMNEGWLALGLGLARSAYAFGKTTFWLGGWSFFPAPLSLVVAYALLIAGTFLVLRSRSGAGRRVRPHAAAALAAVGGFLTFAIANRRLYGDWGGVGGWYFWAWWPWLLTAASDLARFAPSAARPLLAVGALFVLAANVVWFVLASSVYGG